MGSARHQGSIWVSRGQAGGTQRGLLWRRVQVVLQFRAKRNGTGPSFTPFLQHALFTDLHVQPATFYSHKVIFPRRSPAARLAFCGRRRRGDRKTSRVTFAAPASHTSPPHFPPLQMLPVASGESVDLLFKVKQRSEVTDSPPFLCVQLNE